MLALLCGSATSVAPGFPEVAITFSLLQVFRIHQHYSICNRTARSEMCHRDMGGTVAGSGDMLVGLEGNVQAGFGGTPAQLREDMPRPLHR